MYPRRIILALTVLIALPGTGRGQVESGKTADARAAEILLVRGLTSSFIGDHGAAISALTQALSYAPQDPTILSALSSVQVENNQPELALYYAKQARDSSDHIFFDLEYAQRLAESGDSEAAIEQYDQLILQDSTLVGARFYRAQLLSQNGQHRKAAVDLEYVLTNDEGNRLLQGQLYDSYRLGRDSGSLIALLESLIAAEPRESRYWLLLVHHYVQLGRKNDAIRIIERAASANPSSLDIQQVYQRLLANAMVDPKAEALDVEQITSLMADLSLTTHQIDSLASIVSAAGNPTLSMLLDVRRSMTQNRYAATAENLDYLVGQFADSEDVWKLAALAALRSGDYRRTQALCSDGQLIFGFVDVLFVICSYVELQQGVTGTPDFSELERRQDLQGDIDPAAKERDLLMGLSLFQNTPSAISYLEVARSSSSLTGIVLDLLGDLHHRSGNSQLAVKYWREAERFFEENIFLKQKLSDFPN